MLVQQDAIRVIDNISSLVQQDPSKSLAQILQRADISMYDLNQVKSYLQQQHKEQSEKIERIATLMTQRDSVTGQPHNAVMTKEERERCCAKS